MKKSLKVLISIISLILIGIFSSGCSSENITKEQQDNIARSLLRNYDIKTIEFIEIERKFEAGTYNITIRINESDDYATMITFDKIEDLNNVDTEWGLSPIERFKNIERKETIPLEQISLKSIKIKHIGE